MKKQLLLLVLGILASFNLFAQTATGFDEPTTCAGTASAPAIGVPYTYEVDIATIGNFAGTGTYQWYITQNLDIFAASSAFIANGTGFNAEVFYGTPTAPGAEPTPQSIEITWTAFNANPYFLVIKYAETASGTSCNVDNMKVYRIMPKVAFWLGIENVTTTQCAANVSSAIITDATDPGEVEYLYGVNTITTTIRAGGFDGNFAAELDLTGFQPDQTVVVSWTSASGTGTFTAPATNNGIYTASIPTIPTYEDITVTITVTNNHFENLAGQTITIAANGTVDAGGTTYNDITALCLDDPGFSDIATQLITPRPTVNPVNPANFVPQVLP